LAKTLSPLYVGVDVGGTNITTALVTASGSIAARQRRRMSRAGSGDETLAAIIKTIDKLLAESDVEGGALDAIGLGLPAVTDPKDGRVLFSPNTNLAGVKLRRPVEKHFGVPLAIGNDVNVGTLGEFWLGAARGAQSAVGIFVGTGIGGGIISAGRLVTGSRNAAAEIGHIIMQVDGPVCGCGAKGCLEALASRTAIERDIRQAVAAGTQTVLTDILDGDLTRIRSGALKRAVKQNDKLVVKVLRKSSEVLGYACLTVRHFLDPDFIVLGGGVIEACGGFMMPIINEVVATDKVPGVGPGGKVVQSVLGDDAGVLGAAALAQMHVGRSLDVDTARAVPAYPTITSTGFGEVTVGDQVHSNDIYIRADGKVKKRKKGAVKKVHGTSHKIGPEELERVCKGDPEILIIGTGQNGAATLTAEGRGFLQKRGIEFKALPTPEAIRHYNNAQGRKATLIHVTC